MAIQADETLVAPTWRIDPHQETSQLSVSLAQWTLTATLGPPPRPNSDPVAPNLPRHLPSPEGRGFLRDAGGTLRH